MPDHIDGLNKMSKYYYAFRAATTCNLDIRQAGYTPVSNPKMRHASNPAINTLKFIVSTVFCKNAAVIDHHKHNARQHNTYNAPQNGKDQVFYNELINQRFRGSTKCFTYTYFEERP